MSVALAPGRSVDERAVLIGLDRLATAPAGRVRVAVVPAPRVAPERLFAALPDEPAALWHGRDGRVLVGLAEAHRIDARGPERMALAARAAAALWARVDVVAAPDAPALPPPLLGGLAFAPGWHGSPWDAFGDGLFALGRWTYLADAERAWLAIAVDGADDVERARAELPAILGALAGGAAAPDARPVGGARLVETLSPEAWEAEVEAIRDAIRDGSLRKVVAARASVWELERPADPAAVLARLAGRGPLTRFAFRRGGTTFLGATPERLIARRGLEIRSEALAGTIAPGAHAGARLLASAKDRDEHTLVVDAIRAGLQRAGAEVTVAPTPELRAFRDVIHLHTPIAGRLRGPIDVLDLVAALHPTPAVGGAPSDAAQAWIRAREAAPRGWYAGPVGWVDARGDGELAVALRSGVLVGARAHLYAGAGIVAGSDPAAEYRETELKQRALLTALVGEW